MADYLPPPYGKSYDELMKEYPYAPATREKAIADAKKLMADAGLREWHRHRPSTSWSGNPRRTGSWRPTRRPSGSGSWA